MDINKDQVKQVAEKAEGKWGKWGKIVIYGIIGILVGAGILTISSGCSASSTVSFSSEQGMLAVSRDAITGAVSVSVIPAVIVQHKGK